MQVGMKHFCNYLDWGMQCKLQGFLLGFYPWEFGLNPLRIPLWLKSNAENLTLESDLKKETPLNFEATDTIDAEC